MADFNRSKVGVHAMEVYFPKTSVSQTALEEHAGVAAGKFTIGLGQQNMAFCTELEDINSIMMTAVQNLMEKYGISPHEVGRLEVGTETLIDKSKSVKSTVCQLLTEHGNHDVEGIDNINACYGGTAALLNTVAWVESSAYDGRYGIVVCGDIAVYEPGPARPTGGCAAVAMLVGPDAPLYLDGVRSSHMEDAYDFYKPNLDSEYPVVFGHESNECYLRALDNCYNGYAGKFAAAHDKKWSLAEADHVVFHSPYNKLVKKSGARMLYNDFLRGTYDPPEASSKEESELLESARGKDPATTYNDLPLGKAFVNLARPMYESKVAPSTMLPMELGNSYTASCYTGLMSLIDSWRAADEASGINDGGKQHAGKNVLMFSYGSGLASTLFSFKVQGDANKIIEHANLDERLASRETCTPEYFTEALDQREKRYNQKDWSPSGCPETELFPGTYYLAKNDEFGRRTYKRTPLAQSKTARPTASPARQTAGTTFARTFSSLARRALRHIK